MAYETCMWLNSSVILGLWKLKQESCMFEVNLSYIVSTDQLGLSDKTLSQSQTNQTQASEVLEMHLTSQFCHL